MRKRNKLGIAFLALLALFSYALAASSVAPSVGLYWIANVDPTVGGGVAAPLNQLLFRTDSPGIYYKSGAANTSWTRLGSVGAAGTITGGGTANNVTKFTGATTVANSSATDDATTFAINTNKFTVVEASGNTQVAGTFGSTGAATLSSTANVVGDFSVNTNKFNVTAASGNTAIAGTANVVGDFSVATNKFNVTAASGNTAIAGTTDSAGNFSVATNKFNVTASNGNTAIAGTTNSVGDFSVATNKFTAAAATGNTAVAGTLGVTGDVAVNTNKFNVTASSGNTTVAGTLGVTGDVAVNTNKFTVTASSGNTVVAGTLGVTGAVTLSSTLNSKDVAQTVISVATTGTINDWAPTGFSTSQVLYCTQTGNSTFTGLTAGVDGRRITIINASGGLMTFNDESGSSTAANRFHNPESSSTWVLRVGSSMDMVYVGTLSRWFPQAMDRFPALVVNGTATVTTLAGATITGAGNSTWGPGIHHFTFNHSGSGAPTLTGCGTSPAIDGDDTIGTITEGTIATGCTMTFQTSYGVNVTCVVTSQGGLGFTYSTSSTALTIVNVGALSSTKLDYFCGGQGGV